MQSLATGPDIWRRANASPAPRPVLSNSAPTLRPVRRRAPGATAAAIGLAVTIAIALAGALPSRAHPFVAEIERWAELAGFGLNQASVTGYRFTADGDIFDAIDLKHAHTLLSFDIRAAQRRIEALPWVDTASIERILPDAIAVHITERTPIAVLQQGERHFLIDRTGRVLAAIAPSALPPLPRLAGDGAAGAGDELIALLAAHPALAKQLALAERVGGRRWTLRLADGASILLPQTGAAAALARALAIGTARAGRAISIDLRVAGRALLSDASPPAARVHVPAGGT